MKTKTFQKWLDQTDKEAWSETDIIYFRKALHHATPDQGDELLDAVEGKRYALAPEHQDKGNAYLLKQSLKLNGQPRKTNKLSPECINILRNDPIHSLVGFRDTSPGFMPFFVPVYEAKDRFGRSFKYTGVTYALLEVLYIYAPEPRLKLIA